MSEGFFARADPSIEVYDVGVSTFMDEAEEGEREGEASGSFGTI